jgi:RNA polymerase sigma-70 factor (ECF subfamily)
MELLATAELLSANADSPGFGELILRHQALVFRTAWRITGSREDAEDIAQEVFLKFHAHFHRLPSEAHTPWLYRVTTNLSLDLHRKRRFVPLPEEAPQTSIQAPDAQFQQSQQLDQLARAIARLPERERACLVLRDLEGLPARQVAAILDCTEETVRSAAFHAREKLREKLRKWTS